MNVTNHGKEFTGRHMLAITCGFFAAIIAVNLTLAYLANATWSGLIVKNGYVASQNFGAELKRARAQEALGWTVGLRYANGRILAAFRDRDGRAIENLTVSGQLNRPATERNRQTLVFAAEGAGVYAAQAGLARGRWEAEVTASDGGGTIYRRTYRFQAGN